MNRTLISSIAFVIFGGFFVITALQESILNSQHHIHKVYLTRNFLYLISVQFIFMAILFRDNVIKLFQQYFSAESHPLNLAIFRIVIFFAIWQSSLLSGPVFFSDLPKELVYPLPGTEKILQFLPINPASATLAKSILTITAFMTMIGFCTRIAAWIAIISATYYMGIPQFFGKVNHMHFIIWFGMILAASPCSDVLSLDAVLKSFKNIRKGRFAAPAPSKKYGLPIRLIFILFGVLYFFPGFWKLYVSGVDWILSDNLINRMYFKWYELNGWLPFFRIDKYPLLCQIGAGMTILFELSFIFLIFFDKWRYLAVFNGLFFHNMTNLFMKISFWELQKCYVIFFDWYQIFSWVGKKIFKQPVSVVIEDTVPLKRFVAFLQVFDLFQQTEYRVKSKSDSPDEKQTRNNSLSVVTKDKTYFGGRALLILSLRHPIVWGLVPVFFIWPKKEKSMPNETSPALDAALPWSKALKADVSAPRTLLVSIIGYSLILGNIYCGIRKIDSWPFAVFPTFEGAMLYPYKTAMDIVLLDDKGKEILMDQEKLSSKLGSSRYWGLLYRILAEREESRMRKKLHALLEVGARSEPNIKNVQTIKLYQTLQSTLPENRSKGALARQLIFVQNIKNKN